MTGLTLRVVWPILDDAMYENEAIVEATFEWPAFVERHRVELTGEPRMRVIELTAQQETELGASRAVVCEAPAVLRVAQIAGRRAS